jgi:hypothetical protein
MDYISTAGLKIVTINDLINRSGYANRSHNFSISSKNRCRHTTSFDQSFTAINGKTLLTDNGQFMFKLVNVGNSITGYGHQGLFLQKLLNYLG